MKIVYIKLSDPFLSQFGLYLKQDGDEKQQAAITTGPSVKPNYASMAKGSGVEKQTLQTSVTNIFQLIGEVLAEGNNIEVDLGNFGKI